MKVSVKYIEESNEYVDIKAGYPVLSGFVDADFQHNFNAEVKTKMEELVAQAKLQAKSAYDTAVEGGIDMQKCMMDSSVKVYTNAGGILSLGIRISYYMGGAHGSNDAIFYTLSTSPAKIFNTAMELFTDADEAQVRVTDAIAAEIAKDPDSYFESPAAALTESTWFYLAKSKLHIVFPEYAIAPYAAGEPDFGIALSGLKDILADEIPH